MGMLNSKIVPRFFFHLVKVLLFFPRRLKQRKMHLHIHIHLEMTKLLMIKSKYSIYKYIQINGSFINL